MPVHSFLSLFLSLVQAQAPPQEPFSHIDAAARAGRIGRDEAAALRYLAAFEPERLPADFAEDRAPRLRCATPVLLAAQRAAARLPAHLRPDPARLAFSAGAGWAGSLASPTHPLRVSWRDPHDALRAHAVLRFAEQSWDVEIDTLTFRPPILTPDPLGGPPVYDIFLVRGIGYAFTEGYRDYPDTWWDDWSTLIVIDPLAYADKFLRTTVAHELNHAMQATDDWFENLSAMESSATYAEEAVYDQDDSYLITLPAAQQLCFLPFEFDDGYRTWFLYGGVSWLLCLRDRWFQGDPAFLGRAWRLMRSPQRGSMEPPRLNEPDFADAFDLVLRVGPGATYGESILEYDRWRWFTGRRDDGRHYEEGARWPRSAEIRPLLVPAARLPFWSTLPTLAQTGGVFYVQVDVSQAAPGQRLRVDLAGSTPAVTRAESLTYAGGGAHGPWTALFEGAAGAAEVILNPGDQSVVLLLQHLPPPGYDPDFFELGLYPAILSLALVP